VYNVSTLSAIADPGISHAQKIEEFALKYEYQTLEMPLSFGIVKPQLPDLTKVLNEHGREGWQLK
jgi:hypothetical protein